MHNLSYNVQTRAITVDGTNYLLVAGTTDVTSGIVDTLGFYGVRFIYAMGTITTGAVTSFKVQQGDIAAMSDAADLAGSNVVIADTMSNKLAISEIYRPMNRYVRALLDRGTQNAVVNALIVELFEPQFRPVTQDASVGILEFWNGPDEGTA